MDFDLVSDLHIDYWNKDLVPKYPDDNNSETYDIKHIKILDL